MNAEEKKAILNSLTEKKKELIKGLPEMEVSSSDKGELEFAFEDIDELFHDDYGTPKFDPSEDILIREEPLYEFVKKLCLRGLELVAEEYESAEGSADELHEIFEEGQAFCEKLKDFWEEYRLEEECRCGKWLFSDFEESETLNEAEGCLNGEFKSACKTDKGIIRRLARILKPHEGEDEEKQIERARWYLEGAIDEMERSGESAIRDPEFEVSCWDTRSGCTEIFKLV